jgi:3',5'-cyclic AMP phosphodiesterase CpdA
MRPFNAHALPPMPSNFRFAILSDPHIALPHTIWDHPSRFHLVEVGIPAMEQIFAQLEPLDLDFLLIPGDLTQHGEPENHRWLADRLATLPYPAYVIPGNHDLVHRDGTDTAIAAADFPSYYEKFGYDQNRLYYSHTILPGLRLIGLNSIGFDADGNQLAMGHLDAEQFAWLESTLESTEESTDSMTMVMIHHNVIEHLPGQTQSQMGRRYMLGNASQLLQLLQKHQVKLLFTGHLHVQDIAHHQDIYEITTGSLVSYPHPYRILEFQQNQLKIDSRRITQLPGWDDLQHFSREWMGDRSFPFMLKFLTQPPLSLPPAEAERLAPALRYFWAAIANGDGTFDFPQFPPRLNQYFQRFSATEARDNSTVLYL